MPYFVMRASLLLPTNPHPNPPPLAGEGMRGVCKEKGWGEGLYRDLRRGVAHEDLRDRLAPRPAGAFAALQQVGRGAGVENIGVGPVLVHPAPRIGPIIEQLAA